MSLEAAIQENTATMRELINTMTGITIMSGARAAEHPAAPAATPAADKPKREKKLTEGEVAAAALAGTANDPAKYDWETVVKPKLQELQAQVSKEALIAVLQRHGVKSVKELKTSLYPTVMQMAQESIDKKHAAAEDADLGDDDDGLV